MGIVVFSTILLCYNFISSYNFNHNPLSKDILSLINQKEKQIIYNIQKHYNVNIKVPVIISNKMTARLYGLCTLEKNDKISIYLNKKRFQESSDYMINDVLPHEYAHALMFVFGKTTKTNGGHTKAWQKICKNIGGIKCERFVDSNDILYQKEIYFKSKSK